MATASELTLTLGRTLYGGDPDDDEKIRSREVRVSVTWRLTEDEQDLPLTVSVLAEEAQRALDQADRVARRAAAASLTTNVGTTNVGMTARPVPNGASGNGHAAPAPGTGQGQTFGDGQGQPPETGQNGGPGVTAPRYGGYVPPVRKDGNTKDGKRPGQAAPAATPPCAGRPDAISDQPPITAPQRLAIRSLCTRMELAEPELSRLLDGRFGKRRLEELSKADAGALLEALQRGAWEDEADVPAYAN